MLSKCVISESTSQRGGHNSDNENTFLPKELAEIIANRQSRERVWHAQLIIFITFISNVDSTLASFKEDIKKKEVLTFKVNLWLAIANYAAADSSPAQPKISIYSRPSRGNGGGSSKEKIAMKKVAKPIPQKIIPPTVGSREPQWLVMGGW